MASPVQFVWRYQLLLMRNAARQAWACHRRDTLVIALGGGLLLVHEIDVIHIELTEHAAALAKHGMRLLAAGAGMTSVAGILRARRSVRSSASLLSRPWLAPLPWPSETLAQAQLSGCVLPGLAQTLLTAALAALLFSWAGWPQCCAAALLATAAFATGFVTTALAMHAPTVGQRPVRAVEPIAPRFTPFATWIAPIDRARPAWCGTWAVAQLRRRSGVLLFGSAAIITAIGCTIAIAQAWPFVAVAADWVAAHMIFLTLLNALPLASPALRPQPIGFVPAAFAMLRIPLVLSLLAFAGAGTISMVATGAPARLVAAASGLLLLANTIAGITAIGLPTQRSLALFVYVSAVLLTLYEQIEYGYAIYGCLAAFTGFMFRQGRRSFYAR